MDRSEVKRDFETEKFLAKWAWGDAKTFKTFFLRTIFYIKTMRHSWGSNSGSFSATDSEFGSFIAKLLKFKIVSGFLENLIFLKLLR